MNENENELLIGSYFKHENELLLLSGCESSFFIYVFGVWFSLLFFFLWGIFMPITMERLEVEPFTIWIRSYWHFTCSNISKRFILSISLVLSVFEQARECVGCDNPRISGNINEMIEKNTNNQTKCTMISMVRLFILCQ